MPRPRFAALAFALLAAPLAATLSPALAHEHGAAHAPATADAIGAAVAAPHRSEANKARDIYRHPAETLAFFGVTPEQTVAELIPGGGWYSEILAPLLRDKGRYIGLQPAGGIERLKTMFAATPALYDKAELVAWPEGASDIAPGSVDTVLTFRNVHNLVMNDSADSAFAAFFAMLKPGGVLGVVDHRLPEDRPAGEEKTSGYIKVSSVKALAAKAGFELVAQSEINANPKDSANWEKGVWTLPPRLANGETDKAKYLAIGESDRLTLKFRKPLAAK